MKIKPKPVKNPYFAGAILGVVLFGAFALTHSGLGASGAISRIEEARRYVAMSFCEPRSW